MADAAVLIASVLAAWQLRLDVGFGLPQSDPGLSLAASAGPEIVCVWMVLLLARGGYSARTFGAGTDEYRAVLTASMASAGLVAMFCYLADLRLSRGFVLLSFVIGTTALLLERYLARQIVQRARAKGFLMHRVIAVGTSASVTELLRILERERHLGYEVIGVCVPEGSPRLEKDARLPIVGTVRTTRQACAALGADTVLVAQGGYHSSADLRNIAWDLQGSNIELIVVPSLTDIAGPRIHMRPVAGLPLLHLQEPQADEAMGLPKRVFDVTASSAAIVILAPLMLALSILIRLQDGGPILFRQTRIGKDGVPFSCLKFRSMVMNAERQEQRMRADDGHHGALWKGKEDPRITRIGRFIRRYSLDELPQFFNVFKGSMSLVGPRPQQAWEVETYSPSARRRLLVRPGMTGLWQVSGRSELSFDDAVRLDLYYVDNWSLTTDLLIIAKTGRAVFSASGAY